MPQLSSPLSTPAGMPLVNSAHLAKAGGLFMVFATVADLTAAVAAEGSNWPDGQPCKVSTESGTGATRIYLSGLGHARTVDVGGRRFVLASDANTVLPTTGAPSGSGATSGDRRLDIATGLLYTWTTAWDAGTQFLGILSAPGGSGGATVISFTTVLKFDGDYDMGVKFVTGPITMTADMSGAIVGKATRITWVGNGSNVPAMPAGAAEASSSFTYDSTAGYRNWLDIWYDGTGLAYQWSQPVAQTVISNAAQPGFSTQPTITGTPVEGIAAAYTAGAVTGTPTPTSTFEFLLDGVSSGATFTPATADIGKGLAVRQTSTNSNGTASSTSAAKVIVAAGAGTGDADFDSWLARLTAVGGDASTTEKNAVQAFISTAKSGATPFWDVLYRANVFVNNAAGSLVPFKLQSGSSNDSSPAATTVNVGGRTNASGTGYVNTQTPPPAAAGGVSVYLRDIQSFSPASTNVLLGSRDSGNTQVFRIAANLDATSSPLAGSVQGAWGGASTAQSASATGAAIQVGHWHVQRNSDTSLKLRRNGTLIGTEFVTSTTAVPVSEQIYVFANNGGGTAGAFTKTPTSIGYYAILSGVMTDAQAAAYNTAVVAMMTAMGRNL